MLCDPLRGICPFVVRFILFFLKKEMKIALVVACLLCAAQAHRIGLVSIVKNEAAILPRLLASVKPYVDIYVFCDTGSDDGTVELLEQYLAKEGLEGFVARHPWYDFGPNRNMCLDEMKNYLPAILRPDFLLLPDADFELVIKDPKWTDNIPHDYNTIAYVGNSLLYRQATLVTARKECVYHGETHEYLACTDPRHTKGPFDGIAFKHHADGSNRVDKFVRDEISLRRSLEKNPNDPRNNFYLAQTLENLGKYDEAITYYQHRIKLGGWYEEVWYSMYKIGVCKVKREDSSDSFTPDMLAAFELVPTSSEPLFYLTQAYRTEGKYNLCIMFGLFGSKLPIPKDRELFVETSVYEWQFSDELSQCFYWSGAYQESKMLCEQLLENPSVPDNQKVRISANLQFAVQKLSAPTPVTPEPATHATERQPREQFHHHQKREL